MIRDARFGHVHLPISEDSHSRASALAEQQVAEALFRREQGNFRRPVVGAAQPVRDAARLERAAVLPRGRIPRELLPDRGDDECLDRHVGVDAMMCERSVNVVLQ